MRISQLFGKTQREIPAEADNISHQLLLRTGMISQVAAGVYSYLPLGWRVLRKIENIIRDEMDRAGGMFRLGNSNGLNCYLIAQSDGMFNHTIR